MADQTLSRPRLCGKLFLIMLYISAFTFGGGFVIVSLMKRKLVDELHWLEEDEMLDMTAIAQSSPGAIAVNAAIIVGQRLAGAPGIAAAVIGTMIPPIVIITAISFFYGLLGCRACRPAWRRCWWMWYGSWARTRRRTACRPSW